MYKLIVRPVRTWLVARLLGLYQSVVREHVPVGLQRLGTQSWRRVVARWPALGDLVRAGVAGTHAHDPQAPSARKPAPEPIAEAEIVSAERLVAQLRDAGADWQTRARAADALAAWEAPGVIETLIAALHDPSAEVAAAAATALSHKGDPRALDALRRALKNPEGLLSPVTRAAALSGLAGRLAGAELSPVLNAVSDVDAEVSIAAIAAIVERAPTSSEVWLLPVLRNESGFFLPLVRLAAANALERTGVLSRGLAADLLPSERDSAVRSVLQRVAR